MYLLNFRCTYRVSKLYTEGGETGNTLDLEINNRNYDRKFDLNINVNLLRSVSSIERIISDFIVHNL